MLVSWTFPEYIKHRRGIVWYIGIAIILVLLVIFALATQSYIFLMIIVLFIAIDILRRRREPQMMEARITEDGFGFGAKTFYPWEQINSFWIAYDPPAVKNLYLDFKSGIRPSITISLENQNPLRIRKILSAYMPEDVEKDESFSDGLARFLKL